MNIMIIDQSVLIRNQLKEMLCDLPGISIICETAGAAEALLFPFLSIVDLVILDITACEGKGEHIIAQLKNANSTLRVIVLSDHSDEIYRRLACSLGADVLLDKANEFTLLPEAIFSSPRVLISGSEWKGSHRKDSSSTTLI
ncbi:MAG: response regulator transcription factor [Bacteroidetes bacterium]|nr:response regulator transcription factor [Bacteroidota bacterium]